MHLTDVSLAKKCWYDIFSSSDPFTIPFRSHSNHVMVFFPTEAYVLSEEQYSAIRAAAVGNGDEGYFWSYCEASPNFDQLTEHYWCPLPSYNEYTSILDYAVENAIYSAKSEWGVLLSQESHAMIGGTEQFISLVKKNYPNWKSDFESLYEEWRNTNWNGVYTMRPHLEILDEIKLKFS